MKSQDTVKSFSPPFPPLKERDECLEVEEKKKKRKAHGFAYGCTVLHMKIASMGAIRERRERERHFIFFSFSDVKPVLRLFSRKEHELYKLSIQAWSVSIWIS